MPEEPTESPDQADPQAENSKLVPVAESIKYRRRAQQAETRTQQLEQKLEELQSHISSRDDELAAAESQRDEINMRLVRSENERAAERLLSSAGVVDLETACLLLSKRADLSEEVDSEQLQRHVEQLLLDKPFLRNGGAGGASMPPKTASARPVHTSAVAQLTQAAERAVKTGNRRDVAEYLRLRRQTATH